MSKIVIVDPYGEQSLNRDHRFGIKEIECCLIHKKCLKQTSEERMEKSFHIQTLGKARCSEQKENANECFKVWHEHVVQGG